MGPFEQSALCIRGALKDIANRFYPRQKRWNLRCLYQYCPFKSRMLRLSVAKTQSWNRRTGIDRRNPVTQRYCAYLSVSSPSITSLHHVITNFFSPCAQYFFTFCNYPIKSNSFHSCPFLIDVLVRWNCCYRKALVSSYILIECCIGIIIQHQHSSHNLL